MSYKNRFPLLILLMAILVASCGPSEEEQQKRERARQDSLEQARQDSLQTIRQQQQDSLAQAKADSSREPQANQPPNVSFTENGRFTVQVESWRSQWKAEEQAQMWKDRGYNKAFIIRHGSKSSGDIWYRVRTGRVESREEAKQIQQNLQQEYQTQSWIAVAN